MALGFGLCLDSDGEAVRIILFAIIIMLPIMTGCANRETACHNEFATNRTISQKELNRRLVELQLIKYQVINGYGADPTEDP